MKKALWLGIILTLVLAFAGCGREEQKTSYTLTFVSEGAEVETLTAEEGQTVVLREAAADPVKQADGDNLYTFAGWTSAEGGEVIEEYTVTGDAVFYAKFSADPLPVYTVSFVDEWEGKRTEISVQTLKRGERPEIPENTCTHEGYTFTGWSPDPAAEVTQDTEYVAQYSANSYRLVMHVLGEESERQCVFGTELSLSAPELPAFLSFAGWYADGECTRLLSLHKMPARELHVYAKCGFDFGEAKLSVNGREYSGDNRAAVADLPQAEGVTYTYLWKDGTSLPELPLGGAGDYDLSVTVTAHYSSLHEERVFTDTVNIAKRALSGRIEGVPDTVTYGETLSPRLTVTGFVEGDEPVLSPTFKAVGGKYSGDLTDAPLPAGVYVLSAQVPETENYYLDTLEQARCEVTKKELTATLSAEETTVIYGNEFSPVLTLTGFIAGEGEDAVTKNGNVFRYERNGAEAEGHLGAGSYTLTLRAVALSADNYTVGTVVPCTLTVEKAPLTLTVSMERESYVYGEEVKAGVRAEGYCFEDTEEEVFGQKLFAALPPHTGSYPVGQYTVGVNYAGGEVANYTVTVEESKFTVTPKGLQIVLPGVTAVYGDAFEIPAPAAEGLVRGEEEKAQELLASVRYFCDGTPLTARDGKYTAAGKLFAAGHYTLTAEAGTLANYTVTVTEADVTVSARPFTVSSGKVTKSREEKYELIPSFTGEEALLFSATGKLVLNTQDAGSYVMSGSDAGEFFVWEEPLKIVHAGEEVTRNFAISYALDVTLAASRFTVTVPTEGLEFVYDGQERSYPVTAAPIKSEQDTVTPTLKYTVNGEGTEVPAFKDAGVYEVTCTVSAKNYTTEERSFTVRIAKAVYTVNAPDRTYTYVHGSSFGEGVEVTAADGNDYTVTYRCLGSESQDVPKFSRAVERAEVTFTVSEEKNYEEYTGSYTVTVKKAQGRVDVSGVETHYVYTGALQTIDSGATSNNEEDEVLLYSNNKFTTVAEGNALTVKVTLQEGENYTGAEATFRITVVKQTLERLPEEAEPQIPVQMNERGKTLESVTFPDGKFYWKDGGEELVLGEHAYAATYDPDPENIDPLDVMISFTTRRQILTAEVTGGEADYTAGTDISSFTLATLALTDESGTECIDEVEEYVSFRADGKGLTLTDGGTYPVPWTLTFAENDYYEVQYGDTKQASFHDECAFKWKSVELDGVLYTVEDALNLMESGATATVKCNTSFAPQELSARVYADAAYRTVKAGATLLVPYGASDTGVVEQKQPTTGYAAVSPGGYVTLTLPAGELIVNGKLIVNAYRVSNSNQSGNVKGSQYASLALAQGTRVTVKDKGTFESMGFTYGEGEVFAESGATVYEPFAVPGWKGGTISAGVRLTVFPLNQFTASSLIARTHIQAGAIYSLRVALTASSSPQNGVLTFVGTTNALMLLSSGQVTKYLTEEDGKVHFEVEGQVNFGTMSISVSGGQASTAGLQVPIPGHFAIDFLSGSAVIPAQVALKLLPGASLTVGREATLTVAKGGALYAYGDGNYTLGSSLTQWQDGKASTVLCAYPNTYVKDCYRKTPALGYDAKTPATVTVKGTLSVGDGGQFGAEPKGEAGAKLRLSAAAVLENSIKEDYSTTADIGGYFGAFMGNKGAFFTAAFRCGSLAAGNYTFEGGVWKTEE